MSLITTAANATSVLPTSSFHGHGHHKKGGQEDSGTGAAQAQSTTQGLLSSLLQSLVQVTGLRGTALAGSTAATSAMSTAAGVNGTAAATVSSGAGSITGPATAADSTEKMQSFLHSLLQALKADGLGGTGDANPGAATSGTPPAAAASAATATTAGIGHYEGRLVSSLQTLIQQVGSTGTAGATASNLSASFNSLIEGAGAGAQASSGAAAAPNASLQGFLASLLQAVRSGGGHALDTMGTNVNANV